ncbi:MAG: hypothetical protein KF745_12715 [Phycisphaeraceae bacterium]|nr:hypothetical protein [Phycisphaeraceae bacterium]
MRVRKKACHDAEPGAIVAIPLPVGGGYGLGVVARRMPRVRPGNRTTLLYGFGPRYLEMPRNDQIATLSANNATLVVLTGDNQIASGDWPLAGSIKEFLPGEWPVPLFSYYHPTFRRWLLVPHDEHTLQEDCYRERIRITAEEASQCADYSLYGTEAFAIRLEQGIIEGWHGRPPIVDE